MAKTKLLLLTLLGGSVLTFAAAAQETNVYLPTPPPTILENLENASGQLVVKSTEPMGGVSVEGAVISVVGKEDDVIGSNRKYYGAVVEIRFTGQAGVDRTVIDFDEMNVLLSSLDYLSSINWSVTTMSSFDAGFTTKGGLRFSAFSSRRAGQIEFGIRSSRWPRGMLITSGQLTQLRTLLGQTEQKLDTLRRGG